MNETKKKKDKILIVFASVLLALSLSVATGFAIFFACTDTSQTPSLMSISITTQPRTSYTWGEAFDPSGMVVRATFSDDEFRILNDTEFAVSAILNASLDSLLTNDVIMVSFTYREVTQTASINITVSPPAVYLRELVVLNYPRQNYTAGERFDPAGMVIQAGFSDNSVKIVSDYVSLSANANRDLVTADTVITVYFTHGSITENLAIPIIVSVPEAVPVLERIVISVMPQTTYDIGDTFDAYGMVVMAMFSNNTFRILEDTEFTLSENAANPLTADTVILVSFSYEDITRSALINITVVRPTTLMYIFVSGTFRTTLIEGAKFNPDGMVVWAVLSDGTRQEIDYADFDLSDNAYEYLTDDTVIMVTYVRDGIIRTANININITQSLPAVYLMGISIETLPEKTTYWAGEGFDPTGLRVEGALSNGTFKIINVSDLEFSSVLNTDLENLANSDVITVSFEYGGITGTATFSIIVNTARPLRELVVSGHRNFYIQGQYFDTTGMTVIARFYGFPDAIVEGYKIIPSGPLSVSDTFITIEYSEGPDSIDNRISVNVPVIVVAKSVISIAVSGDFQRNYIEGQYVNWEGMIVTATYNDGTTRIIPLNQLTFNISSDTPLVQGSRNIMITYRSGIMLSTAFIINTRERRLTGIEVYVPYDFNLDYLIGDYFDPEGLIVTAFFDNGLHETADNFIFSPDWALREGDSVITIYFEYNGIIKTTAITIRILRTLVSISVDIVSDVFVEGEYFNLDNILVIAHFSDGSTAVITNFSHDHTGALSEGMTTVRISYAEDYSGNEIEVYYYLDITVISNEFLLERRVVQAFFKLMTGQNIEWEDVEQMLEEMDATEDFLSAARSFIANAYGTAMTKESFRAILTLIEDLSFDGQGGPFRLVLDVFEDMVRLNVSNADTAAFLWHFSGYMKEICGIILGVEPDEQMFLMMYELFDTVIGIGESDFSGAFMILFEIIEINIMLFDQIDGIMTGEVSIIGSEFVWLVLGWRADLIDTLAKLCDESMAIIGIFVSAFIPMMISNGFREEYLIQSRDYWQEKADWYYYVLENHADRTTEFRAKIDAFEAEYGTLGQIQSEIWIVQSEIWFLGQQIVNNPYDPLVPQWQTELADREAALDVLEGLMAELQILYGTWIFDEAIGNWVYSYGYNFWRSVQFNISSHEWSLDRAQERLNNYDNVLGTDFFGRVVMQFNNIINDFVSDWLKTRAVLGGMLNRIDGAMASVVHDFLVYGAYPDAIVVVIGQLLNGGLEAFSGGSYYDDIVDFTAQWASRILGLILYVEIHPWEGQEEESEMTAEIIKEMGPHFADAIHWLSTLDYGTRFSQVYHGLDFGSMDYEEAMMWEVRFMVVEIVFEMMGFCINYILGRVCFCWQCSQ